MTETPTEETTEQEPQAEEAPAEPQATNCRWCGAAHEPQEGESEDWLCPECERYQDATTCPVCGQLARLSTLPAEYQPAPAKPKKGK